MVSPELVGWGFPRPHRLRWVVIEGLSPRIDGRWGGEHVTLAWPEQVPHRVLTWLRAPRRLDLR